MKHGSLFSGIGGFDLASEWMGWENVFHCEWMEFPRKVLEYHFPNADSLIDICKTDFKKYEGTIDIISGGFPCQPFSLAGKRKGTDDERYLWGEMLRAVQEIKPKFVIAENVFGITNIDGGLVFEKVCVDLETEGYEVQPFIIPAAAKNAPHRRDRCWFIAFKNTLHGGCLHGEHEQEGAEVRKFGNVGTRGSDGIYLSEGDATNSQRKRLEGHDWKWKRFSINRSNERVFVRSKNKFVFTNTHGNGFHQCNGDDEINASERRINAFGNANKIPSDWEKFPTQSPICGGDDGIPTELDGITFSKWRAESIKGYGNAIVPQVAFELFKVIQKINCNLSK
jgi:DNA (cytosine-5)-methyltransferase 1